MIFCNNTDEQKNGLNSMKWDSVNSQCCLLWCKGNGTIVNCYCISLWHYDADCIIYDWKNLVNVTFLFKSQLKSWHCLHSIHNECAILSTNIICRIIFSQWIRQVYCFTTGRRICNGEDGMTIETHATNKQCWQNIHSVYNITKTDLCQCCNIIIWEIWHILDSVKKEC